MTKEQVQQVLDELNEIKPEKLEGNSKRLFEAIMSIADERDELRQKVKEINKGINSLMQSRKKWKYRYYKMKNKNKDLQKSVQQIYDDYQDIGKMAFNYSDKLEQQEKIIDLMIDCISNMTDCPFEKEGKYLDCERMCDVRTDKECWKQYFENKAKEER